MVRASGLLRAAKRLSSYQQRLYLRSPVPVGARCSSALHLHTDRPKPLPWIGKRSAAVRWGPRKLPFGTAASPRSGNVLSWREIFSLLRLKEFDKAEIDASLKSMCPPDGSMLTTESVARYITHDLRDYKVGKDDDVPEDVARRFINSLDSPCVKASSAQIYRVSSTLHTKAIMPMATSMLLVGSCVGMISPIMPYIVEDLSLTVAQFGYVVSAFGAAKLLGNIPSAILVERHGRKPYLVYSLLAIGAGTAGIGFAGGL